jgi:putative addiction module component (TIGR02574 family)
MKQAEYKNLSIPERILLVEEIWDSIADEATAIELSEGQKNLLKERLVEYKKLDKSERKTWDEIKSKAKAKLKK